MRRNYSNTAVATTLAAGITDSDVSLTVSDATGYPDPPFTITIESEVILVGAKDGTTFSSLTRGYDGTVATAHDAGAAVEHAVVAEDMTTSGVHLLGVPPGMRTALGQGYPNRLLGFEVGVNDAEVSQGKMVFTPFPLQHRSHVSCVSVAVVGVGSEDGALGIYLYGSDEYCIPRADRLIATITDSVPVDTTGQKQFLTDIWLPPGFYWMGWIAQGFTTPPKMKLAKSADHGPASYLSWGRKIDGFWTRYGLHTLSYNDPSDWVISGYSESVYGLSPMCYIVAID